MTPTTAVYAETDVAILGHHRHVTLNKFLNVMQSLLWLEDTCARSGTRWNDFKYGIGEGLYRDREIRRRDPSHTVTLRLHDVFGTRQSDFDAQVRTELSRADIGIDPAGHIADVDTERIMQAAIQFHCGGGCLNVGYVDLPLRNRDVLDMLTHASETLGPDLTLTIWNPSTQPRVVNGTFDMDHQVYGDVALTQYIEVWTKLRAILKSGKDVRDHLIKRFGGGNRTACFAQHGIDLTDRDQEQIVAGSLRRYCPPKRDKCNSRLRLTHAIRPADFVNLMMQVLAN